MTASQLSPTLPSLQLASRAHGIPLPSLYAGSQAQPTTDFIHQGSQYSSTSQPAPQLLCPTTATEHLLSPQTLHVPPLLRTEWSEENLQGVPASSTTSFGS